MAIEPHEIRAVAQPPEAKVSGVAKAPPLAAEPPQPWGGGSGQPPRMHLSSARPQIFQLAMF